MTFHDLLQRIIDKFDANENTVILVIASFIGIMGGFAAVAFFELIVFIRTIAIGSGSNILEILSNLPWYKKLVLPSIGGLIVGPLVYFLGKETKGHGVPEVMESVALRGGRIRSRVMFLKTFVSAVTIATGGSVGREGPIVQIGSSLGSSLGQWLRVGQERLKVLVACGAAAGISATFNAPIAGVMFTVEIILGNYAITTLVPIIMSSVLATIVSRWYFGDIPAFEIPHYSMESAWEIGPYILLGIASGAVAVSFIKVLYFSEDCADKIPIKGWLKTPLMLLPVGVMISCFPQVYGGGYETITQVLKGETIWYMLLLLIPVKMLATSITLSAGGSGGVFAPSLFLGAVFGGSFGTLMHFLFPDVVRSSGAYAVVGMSAMVAGTTHAPLTAFLVIFEMTGHYTLILPLMLCSILASYVASVIKQDSIYTLKLTRRGVDIAQGMEVSIMQTTKVRDVMNGDMAVLDESVPFDDLLQAVINSNQPYFYVKDREGTYQGSFSVHDVKEVLNEEALVGVVVAKDLVPTSSSPSIEMDATLAQCMRTLSIYELEELPVIDNAHSKKLMGRIGRRDIINIYDREILRQGSLGLKFIQAKPPGKFPEQSYVNLPDGCEINLIPVTSPMQGQTLQGLAIRHTYGVTVVAVNRSGERGERKVVIPAPEEILKKGDMLVVIGREDALKRLKEDFRLPS